MNCDMGFNVIRQSMHGFESQIGKQIFFPEMIMAVIPH